MAVLVPSSAVNFIAVRQEPWKALKPAEMRAFLYLQGFYCSPSNTVYFYQCWGENWGEMWGAKRGVNIGFAGSCGIPIGVKFSNIGVSRYATAFCRCRIQEARRRPAAAELRRWCLLPGVHIFLGPDAAAGHGPADGQILAVFAFCDLGGRSVVCIACNGRQGRSGSRAGRSVICGYT